jgi:polysaccharide biosynthesis protein PslG
MRILLITLLIVIIFILVGWMFIHHSADNISSGQSVSSSSTTIVATSTSMVPTSTAIIAVKPTSTPPTVTIFPPESALDIGHGVGIAAGGSLSKISTSTLNQELNQMVALGVTWVRFDIEWGDVQYSSPTSSTWTSYDTLVQALVAHHLHGLGIILFTPMWARAPGCTGGVECPPADPNTFATFASEVAARYKSYGMHYWEIWNEPNNYDSWATKTDCNAYTALLKVTYPAIKKADPDAVVVTGGLSPAATDNHNISPTDFLSCIYKDGGEPYFDAVADHPYSFPTMPSQDQYGAWGEMSETTPNLRSIMIANGDANKKIWITEFGTPTDGPDSQWYVSEASQTAMVKDAMSLYKTYSWAGPFFWYTLEDSGTSTSTNNNFFGLIRGNGTLKPAYSTLQSVIAQGL